MPRRTVMRTMSATLVFALVWASSADAQQVQERTGAQAQAGSAYGAASNLAPAPWLQEDPGAQAYEAARDLLNDRQYRDAAEAFYRLRQEYPRSGYFADSYYYQAFSLSRAGGRSSLREARQLLSTLIDEHQAAATLADAQELLVRVEAQLAQQGDAQAAAAITQQAQEACGPDQEMRVAALNALLNMNSERAIPILQDVLRDRDACSVELRRQAVFLISQKMTDESVDILLDLAHRNPDPDPEVREQAVFWLSQVRSDEALTALESILSESDDPEVQEAALFALSQHGGERAGRVLREFAERPDSPMELRENALFWIGQTPGGGEYLRSVYSRIEDPELRSGLLHSIAQDDSESTRQWLMARVRDTSEDMEVRTEALFWVSQEGGFSIAELRELFGGFDDPELKEQVIFAASQRDDRESVDFLMEVAEDRENGELREQAIFWLGQSDDPRVPDFLLRIIGR
jgi:HEAT repeat protein